MTGIGKPIPENLAKEYFAISLKIANFAFAKHA